MNNSELCHCGQLLHYSNQEIKKRVDDLVDKMGRYIEIQCEDKTYKVDRHFIALHGIKGYELDKYGFEEI